ncbi:MAG: hypothetical protein CME62_13560 [Halobacteriovoraceae bacterium]|nr:hypothetical protein [Halobacteriovoraceae bacterium]
MFRKIKSLGRVFSPILLAYTLFCACFYDPVVTVDETSRTPFFNEIIGPSVGLAINTNRFKLHEPKTKVIFKDTLPNRFKFFNKFLVICSILFAFYYYQNFLSIIKHSLKIRAPSV